MCIYNKCTLKFLRLDDFFFFFFKELLTFSLLELFSTFSTVDIEFGMFYIVLLGSHNCFPLC